MIIIFAIFDSPSIVCPTGVKLALGKLTIRLYRGEDFPQLDPSAKILLRRSSSDLVDPYCIVSYAGQKAETPIRHSCAEPEWNHEICFPFQVSMWKIKRDKQKIILICSF